MTTMNRSNQNNSSSSNYRKNLYASVAGIIIGSIIFVFDPIVWILDSSSPPSKSSSEEIHSTTTSSSSSSSSRIADDDSTTTSSYQNIVEEIVLPITLSPTASPTENITFPCGQTVPNVSFDFTNTHLFFSSYSQVKPPKFFIYEREFEDVDSRMIFGCLQRMAKLPQDDEGDFFLGDIVMSRIFDDSSSYVLTDATIIETLRKHPSRTLNESEATLFVFGFSPLLSYLLPENPSSYGCHLRYPTHEDRIQHIITEMKRTKSFLRSQGSNHIIFCTGCTGEVLGSLQQYIRKSIIVGVRPDPMFRLGGIKKPYVLQPKLYLPHLSTRHILSYKYSSAQEDLSGGVSIDIVMPITKRKTNLLIDAKSGQVDMKSRIEFSAAQFLSEIGSLVPRSFVNIQKTGLEYARVMNPEYVRNHMMAESKFCLIMSTNGNYPRLFDALANGCVPIIIGNVEQVLKVLPFSSLINWKEAVIIVDSLPCLKENVDRFVEFLKDLIELDDQKLIRLQRKAINVFEKLSFFPILPDYRDLASHLSNAGAGAAAAASATGGENDNDLKSANSSTYKIIEEKNSSITTSVDYAADSGATSSLLLTVVEFMDV